MRSTDTKDGQAVRFRYATLLDIPQLIQLLTDDIYNASKESLDPKDRHRYEQAFAAISQQEGNHVLVAEDSEGVVGMLQLTFIHHINFTGSKRAQVEGVRVSSRARGRGVGSALLNEAISRARAAECVLIQLTTNKQRADAIRFYERLGFSPSHVGMKMPLNP